MLFLTFLVKQLHREFARCGSDVLQAFTFYSSDDKLKYKIKEGVVSVSVIIVLFLSRNIASQTFCSLTFNNDHDLI